MTADIVRISSLWLPYEISLSIYNLGSTWRSAARSARRRPPLSCRVTPARRSSVPSATGITSTRRRWRFTCERNTQTATRHVSTALAADHTRGWREASLTRAATNRIAATSVTTRRRRKATSASISSPINTPTTCRRVTVFCKPFLFTRNPVASTQQDEYSEMKQKKNFKLN